MKYACCFPAWLQWILLCASGVSAFPGGAAEPDRSMNVLFIGNSYTARHRLAHVVKDLAEAGNPGLEFTVSRVIYGGRRLVDHWRLGTQNFVRAATLTPEEERATIARLQETARENPEDRYAKQAVGRHRSLLESLQEPREPWDVVVLQSYRDDLKGDGSPYMQYAPKFAEWVHAQGGRVLLHETTPTTQNAEPLDAVPETGPVLEKTRAIARLAEAIDADVVPMSLVAHRCQTERPDLTLRFVNDAHLNQTMAYLTACTFYAALFDRTPQGLPLDRITDIRFLNPENRDKDRDGKPITRVFSETDRADLQRIAWEGYRQFEQVRQEVREAAE